MSITTAILGFLGYLICGWLTVFYMARFGWKFDETGIPPGIVFAVWPYAAVILTVGGIALLAESVGRFAVRTAQPKAPVSESEELLAARREVEAIAPESHD